MGSPQPYAFNPMPLTAPVGKIVKEFGLSADTWRRLADRRLVRAVRVGGARVFDRASCHALVTTGAGVVADHPAGADSPPLDNVVVLQRAFRKARQQAREN